MSAFEALENPNLFPPGTVLLEDAEAHTGHGDGHLRYEPQPSQDPNDPLNWSNARKYVNFFIVSFYTLMIYTIQGVSTIIWAELVEDIPGVTYTGLNNSYGINQAAQAVGCLIFIPIALKYGRRPVYIFSMLITLAISIWSAKQRKIGDIVGNQAVGGLVGAVAETIVQITVADLFFVHQRGTMNGIYLLMVNVGIFVAPVAGGYIADSQGWRWIYWWCTIFMGVSTVLLVCFYEESKYVGIGASNNTSGTVESRERNSRDLQHTESEVVQPKTIEEEQVIQADRSLQHSLSPPLIDHSIPLKSRRERLAFITPSPGDFKSLLRHVWQPFVINVTYPAATYCAIQYSSILMWLSIVATTQPAIFAYPPYNFSPAGIALLNLPSFIGTAAGFAWGGVLSDKFIVWMSRRNQGLYEPEMRLWMNIVPGVTGPAGLFMYGYAAAAGSPWITPCIGLGLYGFSISSIGATSLTYLSDCYREIVGDALVGIAFLRSVFAMIVVFALTAWLDGMGLHGLFTCVGCLALLINLLAVPMIFFGKRFRIKNAKRYQRLAEEQYDARSVF